MMWDYVNMNPDAKTMSRDSSHVANAPHGRSHVPASRDTRYMI